MEAMGDAQALPNSDLWRCDFAGDNAKTHCTHPSRTFDRHISLLFNKFLGNLTGVLPSLRFLVNHLDEPRVVVPPQSSSGRGYGGKRQLCMIDMKRQPTWEKITRFCGIRASDEGAQSASTINTLGIPFVTNRASAMNLCQHPEYSGMHGLFVGPTSFPLIEGLVPVLSSGSPSTMGDILFPSPAYFESRFLYNEAQDVNWESKSNKLYWAGSTTGVSPQVASGASFTGRDSCRWRRIWSVVGIHICEKEAR